MRWTGSLSCAWARGAATHNAPARAQAAIAPRTMTDLEIANTSSLRLTLNPNRDARGTDNPLVFLCFCRFFFHFLLQLLLLFHLVVQVAARSCDAFGGHEQAGTGIGRRRELRLWGETADRLKPSAQSRGQWGCARFRRSDRPIRRNPKWRTGDRSSRESLSADRSAGADAAAGCARRSWETHSRPPATSS